MDNSIQYKSSSNQIIEFFEGYIWQDIKYELDIWIKELQAKLEHEDTRNIVDVARAQGSIRALREIIELEASMPLNAQALEEYYQDRKED